MLRDYDRRRRPRTHSTVVWAAEGVLAGLARDAAALRPRTRRGPLAPSAARAFLLRSHAVRYLPPRYADLYTPDFLDRFAASVDAVRKALDSDKPHYLNSLLAELAAHAILRRANEIGLTDHQTAILYDEIFEDTDFLFLYDDAADGIDASPVGAALGMRNMAFASWGDPFDPEFPSDLSVA